jgi:hypothetical protein
MLYRVGGLLIAIASVGFGSLLALAQAGQPVDALDNPLTVGLFYGSAICGSLGSWWVGRHGTIQREGVYGRFGLGLVAVGLLALVAGQLLVTFIASQGDPSADPAYLVILGGYVSVLAGAIVIGLAFIVRGGLRRVIGSLLLAGPVVFVLAFAVRAVGLIGAILPLAGVAILLVGWLCLGVLAMRSDKGPQPLTSESH